MSIVLLCSTQRGKKFLKKLIELKDRRELVVFSFKEDPWEPPFLEDIRKLALEFDAKFFESKNVGKKEFDEFWNSNEIELILLVNWRYKIPKKIYERAKYGTFVLHDSLLPKYRGFSPTVWALINGEDITGVTLFKISEEIDEGKIVDQQIVPIHSEDNIESISLKLDQAYLDIFELNYNNLINGNIILKAQDSSKASYTCKISPEDAIIDWSWDTEKIYNLIRAYTFPYPGAYTFLKEKKIKILSARLLENPKNYVGNIPGKIVEIIPNEGSIVLTGNGSLLITKVEIDNKIVCAAEVMNSIKLKLGNYQNRML